MPTSIIVTTKGTSPSAKSRKRSITDINPNATNAEMKNFAVALVGLTNSQYIESDRVDKTNLDGVDDRKYFRQITIENAAVNQTATITFKITANEEVSPICFFTTANSTEKLTTTREESTSPTTAIFSVTIPNSTGTLFTGISEKANFYSELIKTNI